MDENIAVYFEAAGRRVKDAKIELTRKEPRLQWGCCENQIKGVYVRSMGKSRSDYHGTPYCNALEDADVCQCRWG
jgi:hypothetical protein